MRSDLCSLIRSGELVTICSDVTQLSVGNDTCNDEWLTALDMTFITNLRVLEVGDHSFAHVKEVKLIGLNELESVVIGENCFTMKDSRSQLHLKDCERLRELRIGDHSFEKYSSWVIVNLPSLEEIEVGEWRDKKYCGLQTAIRVKGE